MRNQTKAMVQAAPQGQLGRLRITQRQQRLRGAGLDEDKGGERGGGAGPPLAANRCRVARYSSRS